MSDIPTSAVIKGTLTAKLPFVASILVVLYLFYRWALPKPIPGIPHNKEAVRSILGDMPELVRHVSRTGTIFPWIQQQNVNLNSPITQIFTRPMQKPWVVITDFRESQDILLRRTKEFDRSKFFGDIFESLIPDHHISKLSHDPKFKSNRNLTKDLMTPAFLNEVAAPQIHSAISTLIDLWATKQRLSEGHPFSAFDDVYNAALDAVFAFTFGLSSRESITDAQLQLVLSAAHPEIPSDNDKPVEFPVAPHPPQFKAILTLSESVETSIKSPIPRQAHWCLRQLPYMRKAIANKEKLIDDQLDKGIKRLSDGDYRKRCALDDMMHRELLAAKKEERAPVFKSRAISDELFGFLIAGHDTTSTTVTWALKHLSDNPSVQQTLRLNLRSAFTTATTERRNPTADEISKSHIPYLDAAIEEIVRMSQTAPGVIRNALTDTVILGHHIPKGTDVFMMGNGPGVLSDPIPIDEATRNESARAAKGRQVGAWDVGSMQMFNPGRWLVKNDDGKEAFDPQAGPHLVFGLGPRGCFGKRLAYLELRIIIAMIVWNFELGQCPERLNSYEATDRLTRQPRQCYLKLTGAGL